MTRDITNEKVSEYLDLKYKPIDAELASFREYNENKDVPLILKETEGILSVLLDIVKPENILEIGTAYGYSAIFFAKKLPDSTITTIDRGQRMIPIAEETFKTWNEGKRINFLTGDAREVLDELFLQSYENEEFKKFDFAFIDAGKSHYKEFFDRVEKLCNPGAVIVCDNILMRGWLVDRSIEGGKRHRTNIKYMKQFLDYINERDDLTVSLLSSGDGLAIIRLNEK